MKTLTRMARFRLCDDAAAYRTAEVLCYAVGPFILIAAIRTLVRMGATRVEMLLGCLAACGVALAAVALGGLLGLRADLRRR